MNRHMYGSMYMYKIVHVPVHKSRHGQGYENGIHVNMNIVIDVDTNMYKNIYWVFSNSVQ